MTDASAGVGVAHLRSGYRPPVLLLLAALGAALASAWEEHLTGPWAEFCDEAAG